MAVWSEVDFAELENKLRLEAQFYQPFYLAAYEEIRHCGLPIMRLHSLCKKVTDGSHITPEYQEEGIRFLMVRDVREESIEFENSKFITKELDERLKHCKPCGSDVLLTKVGSIGIAAVVPDDAPEFNIFVSLAVIKGIHGVDPTYLSTFLNSRFGRVQAFRQAKGISQPDLHLEEIREFLIPIPNKGFQESIKSLLLQAKLRRSQSTALYVEAENLLLHELGLDTLDHSHELTYERNFSEVAAAGRYDAQFFQPKYQKVVDALTKKWTVESIGSWGRVLKGQSVSEYIEKGVPVVRSGDLTDIDNVASFKHASPAEDLFYLKRGDVCISSIGFGSIGKVQVFDKEDQPYATVSEVTVVRQNRVNPYYLQIFLQSLAGQLQIERWITGATGQLHLYPRDVEKFIIPVLPEAQQLRFEKIANKARQVRQEAKQLLEDAKRRVEQMILGEDASHVA
jgi:restriction endonuclease S subunit